MALNKIWNIHVNPCHRRNVYLNAGLCGYFHEFDKKGGYKTEKKTESRKEVIREGLKELKKEIGVWQSEWKERFQFDPIAALPQPGNIALQHLKYHNFSLQLLYRRSGSTVVLW